MVFPDYAPLDHVLPRYLSVALLRRLNMKNIKTIGHSSLRWVGPSGRTLHALPPPPSLLQQNSGLVADGTDSANDNDSSSTTDSTNETDSANQSDSARITEPAHVTDSASDLDSGNTTDSTTALEPVLSTVVGSSATEADGLVKDDPDPKRSVNRRHRRRVQVMTAHSFDHLDTATHTTDRVVLAGVDVAPLSVTLDLHGKDSSGRDTTAGPIARRKKAGTLEVDRRRGAVVVNAELAATSRVWAAGDVACFPSQAHGGRRLVLRSADHAYHSGKLAGDNMAAAGVSAQEGAEGGGGGGGGGRGRVGGRRYCHSPAFVGEAPLAGVRMATVGDCSAALPTHGFWWTNNATGLRRKTTAFNVKRTLTRSPPAAQDGERAGGVTLRSRRTARREFTPVFGTGVVFYTDGAEVRGAMLWGFPGEATTAASQGFQVEEGGARGVTPKDAAAGISARALDVLRDIMERSANIEADLSDERVLQAWVQGLSDAAKVVAQETGLGHLQPMRR